MRRHVSAVGCSFVITNTTFGAVFSADQEEQIKVKKKPIINAKKDFPSSN